MLFLQAFIKKVRLLSRLSVSRFLDIIKIKRNLRHVFMTLLLYTIDIGVYATGLQACRMDPVSLVHLTMLVLGSQIISKPYFCYLEIQNMYNHC